MKNLYSLTLVFILSFFLGTELQAQCASAFNSSRGVSAASAPTCSNQTVSNLDPYEGITFSVVAGDNYRISINNINWNNEEVTVFNNVGGALVGGSSGGGGATYNWTSGFTGTVRAVTSRNCVTTGSFGWFSGMNSATLTYRRTGTGDPSTFGASEWRVHVYDGNDYDLGSGLIYNGFYTETNLTYDSRNRWGATGTPASASGYVGCDPGVDNHTVVSKRQGFTAQYYSIDVTNHDDNARLLINGTSVWNHVGCCDAHDCVWTGYLDGSSTVEFRHGEGGGGSHQGLRFNELGDPGSFGINEWNIYGYNGRNRDNLAAITYYGYYVNTGVGFSTFSDYGSGASPSSATGYVGCDIPNDNHTVVAKRQGFPCDVYELNVTGHDDEASLLVNGTSVWTANCCSDNGVKWTGVLDATSTVEMRYAEGGGGAGMALAVTDVSTALNGGVISYSGLTTGCNGYNPPAFGNSSAASGGASAVITNGTTSYQWQLGGSNIGGETGATYDPGALSPGTYVYRRVATDKCGASDNSNTHTITVLANASATAGPNQTICQGGTTPGLGGGVGGSATGGTWSTPAGGSFSPNANTLNATWTPPGAYSGAATLTLTTTGMAPCFAATSTKTVTVQSNSTAAATATASPTFVCSGDAVTLSLTGGSLGTGATWEWYRDAGLTANVGSGTSITVNPIANTTYYVRAEGTCNTTPDVNTVEVIVNGGSTPPSGATLVSSTTSSTCNVSGTNWHYFYNSSGDLLAGINSNGNNLGSVTVDITVGDAGPFGIGNAPGVCGATGASGGEYTMARYWDISVTTQPSSDVDVRFYYTGAELTAFESLVDAQTVAYRDCWGDVNGEADLMMTVDHGLGSYEMFPSLTGDVIAGPGTDIREYQFAIDEFSGGKLHANGGIQGANPLPVELLTWEAKAKDNEFIELAWSTATEINNDGFEIERSIDGVNFTRIAWAEGNGNSTEIQNYNYEDREVSKGVRYYYRLKQIDNDGTTETFEVVSAILTGKDQSVIGNLIPNPSKDNNLVKVNIESVSSESVNITIYNHVGARVASYQESISEGSNNLQININDLSGGTYFINFNGSFGTETRKLMLLK